jgi:hypothetical protein
MGGEVDVSTVVGLWKRRQEFLCFDGRVSYGPNQHIFVQLFNHIKSRGFRIKQLRCFPS